MTKYIAHIPEGQLDTFEANMKLAAKARQIKDNCYIWDCLHNRQGWPIVDDSGFYCSKGLTYPESEWKYKGRLGLLIRKILIACKIIKIYKCEHFYNIHSGGGCRCN